MRILSCIAAVWLAMSAAAAQPRPELIDERWLQTGDAGPVDHALWDEFLAEFTELAADGIRYVDYGRAASDGRALTMRYLETLQGVDPTALPRPEQFAYWANLYNAVTVDLVLEAWPVQSVREIGGSLFAPGPWRKPRIQIAGQELSLDDIEHGILRPIWRDPRVHYAVNCASLGCPNLDARAFRGEGLSEALDRAARAYVNHPRGARVEGGALRVSSIYDWFEEDFGGSDAGVIDHLRRYANAALLDRLQGVSRIAGDSYDWSLNDVARAP